MSFDVHKLADGTWTVQCWHDSKVQLVSIVCLCGHYPLCSLAMQHDGSMLKLKSLWHQINFTHW
eukprot:4895624-Amphidinium_carterae.3